MKPHWLIITFIWIIALYPLWMRAASISWRLDESLIANIFPFFGLLAVSLLWLHAVSGVFEPWLRKQMDFDRFVHITASIILVCLIMHPLLALATFRFSLTDLYGSYGFWYILLGTIGWALLITYDIGKTLKKRYDFFRKQWTNILIISNIGFLITFFHSLQVGSDLQQGPLRWIWIFYGITAAVCIFFTYALKRFVK